MPALVTLAPVQIDLVQYSRQFANEINPMGIFLVGVNLYVVLQNSVSGNKVSVFKSTDKGATWANMDTAHEPALDGGKNVFFSSSTGLITVMTSNLSGGGGYKIFQFNTATDLWATITGDTLPVGNQSVVYVQSGGLIVNLYSFGADIDIKTVTGGVWSGVSTLISGGVSDVKGGAMDSSDREHLLFNSGTTLKYVLVSAGIVAGAPTSLGTMDVHRPDILFWGTNVVVAWTNTNSVSVAIGTPLGAAVFTTYTVKTSIGSDHLSYATLAQDKDGNLVVFWVEIDYSVVPVVDRLWMSTFDGINTWGAPVLFYDELADRPSNAIELHTGNDTDQFVHTGNAIQLADGTWIFSTAMETWDITNGFQCTGFALLAPGLSPVDISLIFNLHGGPGIGGEVLIVVNPPPPGPPGPVVNPTECVNQE